MIRFTYLLTALQNIMIDSKWALPRILKVHTINQNSRSSRAEVLYSSAEIFGKETNWRFDFIFILFAKENNAYFKMISLIMQS